MVNVLFLKSCFVWSTEVRIWLHIETPVNKRQHFCFNTFIRQWGVYKVEKPKDDAWEPRELHSRNFFYDTEITFTDQK